MDLIVPSVTEILTRVVGRISVAPTAGELVNVAAGGGGGGGAGVDVEDEGGSSEVLGRMLDGGAAEVVAVVWAAELPPEPEPAGTVTASELPVAASDVVAAAGEIAPAEAEPWLFEQAVTSREATTNTPATATARGQRRVTTPTVPIVTVDPL